MQLAGGDVNNALDLSEYPDWLIALASANGQAYRHLDHGSFFPIVTERNINYHYTQHDLEHIIRAGVIPEVRKLTHILGCQSAHCVSSLRHNVRFPMVQLSSLRVEYREDCMTSPSSRDYPVKVGTTDPNKHIQYRVYEPVYT